MDDTKAANTATPSQGEDLSKGEILLPPLRKILKTRTDWKIWLYYVKVNLEVYGLADLIRPEIPRPLTTDATYKSWKKCSLRVKAWLACHISEDLVERMEASPIPSEFADEYINKLQNIINREELDGDILRTAVMTKREDYETCEQFVKALCRNCTYSNDIGMTIKPSLMSFLLFRGIKKEFGAYVKAKTSLMPDYEAKDMTLDKFYEICDEVLAKARINQSKSTASYTKGEPS